MSDYWIDVFSAGGGPSAPSSRLGAGPIRSALDWESTRKLDAVGSFSFSMPASDPKAALVRPRNVVWCYVVVETDDPDAPSYYPQMVLGSGVIEKITTDEGPPLTIRVSGPDLLGELSERTVGEMDILEKGWTSLAPIGGVAYGSVRYLYAGSTPPNQDEALTEAFDGNDVNSTASFGFFDDAFFYIGHDARFDRIRWMLGATKNTTADTTVDNLRGQYYAQDGQWKSLTITANGTSDPTTPPNFKILAKDGDVIFDRPLDWARIATAAEDSGNWFWTRWYRANAIGNNFNLTLAEVYVYADLPTKNGLNLIMAHAPAAWGVSGFPETLSEHYVRFDGESVIAALIALTEHGGQIPQ